MVKTLILFLGVSITFGVFFGENPGRNWRGLNSNTFPWKDWIFVAKTPKKKTKHDDKFPNVARQEFSRIPWTFSLPTSHLSQAGFVFVNMFRGSRPSTWPIWHHVGYVLRSSIWGCRNRQVKPKLSEEPLVSAKFRGFVPFFLFFLVTSWDSMWKAGKCVGCSVSWVEIPHTNLRI